MSSKVYLICGKYTRAFRSLPYRYIPESPCSIYRAGRLEVHFIGSPPGFRGGGSPREGGEGSGAMPCRRPHGAIAAVLEGSRYKTISFLCVPRWSRDHNFHKGACQMYGVFVCFRFLRYDLLRFCSCRSLVGSLGLPWGCFGRR